MSKAFVGTVAAILSSVAVGVVLVVLIGADPGEVAREFGRGTVGSWYGVGQLLFRTTSLVFAGLAVVLPYRAGLFNVGAEGQIYVGSLAAACAGLALPGLPAWAAVPVCVLAAAGGGADLSNVRIKFQQYDNYPASSDGREIDNIKIKAI